MADGERRKPGRPRKSPQTQGNFTFRTPVGLREQLEREAAASGRSVSEEITYRLQRSFDREALLNDVRDVIRAEIKA